MPAGWIDDARRPQYVARLAARRDALPRSWRPRVASPFDYAIIRVVPRVEREEFVNAGVIVFARTLDYLGCACALDVRDVARRSIRADRAAIRRHHRRVRLRGDA